MAEKQPWADAPCPTVLKSEDVFFQDEKLIILNEPLSEDDDQVVIPVIQEGDPTPWGGVFKWADERQWCGCVHDFLNDEANPHFLDVLADRSACPMWSCDDDTPGGFCRLNGYRDPATRTPCLLDEPLDSDGWHKARRWKRVLDPVLGDTVLTLAKEAERG